MKTSGRFTASHQAPHVWAIHDTTTGSVVAELDDSQADDKRSDAEIGLQAQIMAEALDSTYAWAAFFLRDKAGRKAG